MCGSKPKPPPVIVRDPVADAATAANDAQKTANAETAARRKRLKGSSLFTSGARGTPGAARFSAYAEANAVNRGSTLGGTT
jgi:hypothetical protein